MTKKNNIKEFHLEIKGTEDDRKALAWFLHQRDLQKFSLHEEKDGKKKKGNNYYANKMIRLMKFLIEYEPNSLTFPQIIIMQEESEISAFLDDP